MPDVLCLYPGPASFRQRQVAQHRALLDALGVRLLLADDYADPGDATCFAEFVQLPPPEEVRAARCVLEAWLRGRRVDAVLAQSEAGLGLGSLVARECSLPCIPPEAALLVTSKHLCRERLHAAGVTQPRFALVADAASVRRFANEVGFPVVLKATSSALARLVALVRAPGEIDAAVERMRAELPRSQDVRRLVELAAEAGFEIGYDPRQRFLVEEFARGLPVETDGFVAGAQIATYGVTEQVMTAPPLFFFEGYLLPADRPKGELVEVERTSDAALRALGVRDTGFSIEMRLDGGRASVIEVNGRLGWDEGFGDLFATVTGVQPALHTLQIALGQKPAIVRRDVRAAVAYACCFEDCVVARVPTAEEIARVEREHGVRTGLAVWEGERMHAPPSPDVAPHLAWALATDPRSSRAAYARARSAVLALPFETTSLEEPPLRQAGGLRGDS